MDAVCSCGFDLGRGTETAFFFSISPSKMHEFVLQVKHVNIFLPLSWLFKCLRFVLLLDVTL